MNIAVFASGNGSNFEALVESGADVKLLVCDKPGAYALERAEGHGIPSFVFRPGDFTSKADYERKITEKLKEYNIGLIVLAGYMRLIGPVLLQAYEGRIINIHPSLLPAFPGLDAVGQAMKAGVRVTGVTVHFVDEGMDTGPIIAQEPVKIEAGDTLDEVTRKIQQVEHELYPATVQRVAEDLKRGVRR